MTKAITITVANQKGGSGKTTVCMQLAGSLAESERSVLVIDADQQRSAMRWAAAANNTLRFPAKVIDYTRSRDPVHYEIARQFRRYDYILVDCPPSADSPTHRSALLLADLALVPFVPSPMDLWSTVGIRTLIFRMSKVNKKLKSRLVANMCQPNTRMHQDMLRLTKDLGIPLLDTKLHMRTAYRKSALYGATVQRLGSYASAAKREVAALTKEIITLTEPPDSTEFEREIRESTATPLRAVSAAGQASTG